MPRIVLDERQFREISGQTGPVEICDSKGNQIASFTLPAAPEFLAEAKRRAK